MALNENFHLFAKKVLPLFGGDLFVKGKESLEPLFFDRFGNIIFPPHCGGPFAGAVGVEEGDRVADLSKHFERFFKLFVGFCRKAYNDVGS